MHTDRDIKFCLLIRPSRHKWREREAWIQLTRRKSNLFSASSMVDLWERNLDSCTYPSRWFPSVEQVKTVSSLFGTIARETSASYYTYHVRVYLYTSISVAIRYSTRTEIVPQERVRFYIILYIIYNLPLVSHCIIAPSLLPSFHILKGRCMYVFHETFSSSFQSPVTLRMCPCSPSRSFPQTAKQSRSSNHRGTLHSLWRMSL